MSVLRRRLPGRHPKISKTQLVTALKRRSQLDLDVNNEVWKRCQNFYKNQVQGRLRRAATASGLPALAAKRSTEHCILGGAPDKAHAFFWLCLDVDGESEEQTTSKTCAPTQGCRPTPYAATKASTPREHGSRTAEAPNELGPETEAVA